MKESETPNHRRLSQREMHWCWAWLCLGRAGDDDLSLAVELGDYSSLTRAEALYDWEQQPPDFFVYRSVVKAGQIQREMRMLGRECQLWEFLDRVTIGGDHLVLQGYL